MQDNSLKTTLVRIRGLHWLLDCLIAFICAGFIVVTFKLAENKSVQQTQSNVISPALNPATQNQLTRFINLSKTQHQEFEAWKTLQTWTYEKQVHVGFCSFELTEQSSNRSISLQCNGLGQTTPKQFANKPVWANEANVFTNKPLVNPTKTVANKPQKSPACNCDQPPKVALPYGEYFLQDETLVFEPKQQSWGKNK